MTLDSSEHQPTTHGPPARAAPYAFCLLGELVITQAGQPVDSPPYRTHSLLAALLLHPGPQRRAFLIGLLYPDLPERSGRKRLSDLVYLLRRSLPDLLLETSAQEVGLPVEGRWLDVEAFAEAVAHERLEDWLAALALYRGDLLASVYDDWLLVEREAIYLRYVHLLHRTCRVLLDARRYDRLIPLAERLVRAEPYDESGLRILMRAYRAVGRRGAALAAYERFLARAADELGVEPDPRTQALANEIRDAGLLAQPGNGHELPATEDAGALYAAARGALARGDLSVADECLRRLRLLNGDAADVICLIEIDRALFYEDLGAAERLLATCDRTDAPLLVRAARLALARRQSERARELAQQALGALHGTEDGSEAQVDALLVLAQVQQRLGQGIRAARSLEQALALARSCASASCTVRALVLRGYTAIRQGRYDQALVTLQEARGLAQEHGLRPGLGEALRGIGVVCSYQGALLEALAVQQQELEVWRDLDLMNRASGTMHNLAYTQAQLGRTADSIRTLEQARPLCERSGDAVRLALNQYNLAETMLYHDDALAGESQALITQALDTFVGCERPGWEAAASSTLGQALWLQGQCDAALAAFARAYDGYEALDELAFLPELLSWQALSTLGVGEVEQALALCRRAQLLAAQGAVSGEASYEVGYACGMALAANDQPAQACEQFVRAYQILLEQAAQLSEEGARQAFFHHSPVARRLMQEVYARGIASPPNEGRVDARLPSARGSHPVRVHWTVDAGPADAALKQARGAIALRRARLARLLDEAASQGAQPTLDQLCAVLGVSRRTVQRDLAALRREEPFLHR